MDFKNLEKMFEVFVSLEPANLGHQRSDEHVERSMNVNIQNSGMLLKPRKPSLPLAVSAPSARRGSVDTRKSLFYNERNQFNSYVNPMPLFRTISRQPQQVLQERESAEMSNEDYVHNHSLPKYCNNLNVYDTVLIGINIDDDLKATDDTEIKFKNNGKTDAASQIDFPFPQSSVLCNNLDVMNTNTQRYSNLSDNACQTRSIESTRDKTGLQSAPESARNSTRVVSLYSKDNQSSIDSGVDQPISSVNLNSYLSNETTNSNESFSDISESNMYTCSESPDANDGTNTLTSSKLGSDLYLKSTESTDQRNLLSITTDEERKAYFRQISKELSLADVSPKEIIVFYTKDCTSTLLIDKFQTAVSVCNLLKKKFNKPESTFWQLSEVIEKESLERPLEDHENILEVFYSWEGDHIYNKFVFLESPSMYKIFEHPTKFTLEMKSDFEISDVMWVKPANSKWIYTTCNIYNGFVNYTLKKGSKTPKDVYCLVNLMEVDVYVSSNVKKIKRDIKAQTSHIIIFKKNKLDHRCQENAYLGALNVEQKNKWLEAIKVAKYSFNQLKNNYLENKMCFPTGFRSPAVSDVTIQDSHDNFDVFTL